MSAFYWLGNGDYSIEEKIDHFCIWNNALGEREIYTPMVKDRAKLVQWLSNRYLYVVPEKNTILNPIGSITRNLLAIHEKKETSYNERLVIGLTLASLSDYNENPHKTGKLTSNNL